MSWHICIIGKPADVNAYLAGISYFPQPLKDTVALFTGALPPGNLVNLETYGHFDSASGGTVGKFELGTALLVEAPPTPPPASHPQPSTKKPSTT